MNLISFRTGRSVAVELPADLAAEPLLITLDSGRAATLRRLWFRDESECVRAKEAQLPLARTTGLALRRPLAAAVDGRSMVLASEPPAGAPLRTVARLVPLTWEQAAQLGENLLAAVAALHRLRAGHGDLSMENAVLCTDGRVRLIHAGLTGRDQLRVAGDDLRRSSQCLTELLASVSPRSAAAVPPPTRQALLLLADQITTSESALKAWRTAVRRHLDPDSRQRVLAQLQALARRLAPEEVTARAVGREEEAGAPAVEVVPAPPAVTEAAATLPEIARAAVRRRFRWLAALVLLLVAGSAVALVGAHRPHVAPGQAPRRAPQTLQIIAPTPTAAVPTPTSSPPPAPSPSASPLSPAQLPAVPLLAPPSNYPVQEVELVRNCQVQGASGCQYTVTADLGSHPATTVAWEVVAIDRCTGTVTQVAAGEIPAPSSYTYVEAQPQIPAVAGVPIAMVALAGAPGEAASAPLLITPGGATCPS